MKFSKILKAQQVQEWRKMYISYDSLKDLIKNEQEFFEALEAEAAKVESFCRELNFRAEVGLNNLLDSIPEETYPAVYKILCEGWQFPKIRNTRKGWVPPARKDKRKSIKKIRETTVVEFYLIMSKILRYKELNKTGFRKILKKYDKQKGTSIGSTVFKRILSMPVFSDDKINQIWEFTKIIYRMVMPAKGKGRAKKLVLDIIKGDEDGDKNSFFAGGMVVGGFIFLFLRLWEDFSFWHGALGVADWLCVSMGIMWYGSRANYVNYSMIMDLSIKPNIKISKFFVLIGLFCLLHGGCAFMYVPWIFSFLLTMAILVLPLDVMYKETRAYLFTTFLQIFSCTLFTKVEFRHFFIADHLLSIQPILCCFLSLDRHISDRFLFLAIINIIPVGIRISQCMRRHIEVPKEKSSLHLYNLTKYIVVLLSKLSMLFLDQVGTSLAGFMYVLANTLCFVWDIWVDWMLPERPRMYQTNTYIFGCTLNMFIRLFAVLFFFVDKKNLISMSSTERETTALVLAVLEVFRRGIWSAFRLEVEHLNNCDQLKATSGPLTDLFYLASANSRSNSTHTSISKQFSDIIHKG
ncbi:xenotropic and polytropic retrovirus receptor 1 [Nematocida sp. AWRm77]|nr:xenotropic and polytropic retrovirus receptor 1 [Nematocida sp. AWRm77]